MTAETDQSRRDLLRTFVIGGSGLVVGGIVGFTVARAAESNQTQQAIEGPINFQLQYSRKLHAFINQERLDQGLVGLFGHSGLYQAANDYALTLAQLEWDENKPLPALSIE